MTSWREFSDNAPTLAEAVRARFEVTRHHVLATLRRDGAPRVSGTEVSWRGDDIVLGSMTGAVKARDLQRDSRFALHANPGDGSMTGGDAKLSGRAIEVVDPAELSSFGEDEQPPGDFHLFRLDLTDVVLTSVRDNHLVIQLWRPGTGVTEFTRH